LLCAPNPARGFTNLPSKASGVWQVFGPLLN
jgi:hypothetical protein